MNRFLSDGRVSLTSLMGVAFFAAITVCAGAWASNIGIINPTFTATLDQPLTFNSNSYTAGDPIPQGTYVHGNGTGMALYDESTDLQIGGDTASFLGWTASTARAGVVDPNEITSGLTDAGNVGNLVTLNDGPFYANGNTALTQDLGIPFQPNTIYTLSVELLLKNIPVSPVFYADLTAGGTRVNGTQVLVDPTQATLGSDIVTFATGAIAPVGNLGIVLHATDSSGNLTQIFVDNVSLTSVPEPASLGMLALGGMMLLSRRRKIA